MFCQPSALKKSACQTIICREEEEEEKQAFTHVLSVTFWLKGSQIDGVVKDHSSRTWAVATS